MMSTQLYYCAPFWLPSCSNAKGVERVPAFFFPGSTVGDVDTFWTFREMSVGHIWTLNELQEILQDSAHSHSYQAAVTHLGPWLPALSLWNSELVSCLYRDLWMLACDLAASTSGLGRGGDVPLALLLSRCWSAEWQYRAHEIEVEQFSGCSHSRLAEVQRQRFLIAL